MAKRSSFLLRSDAETLAALRRWADDELRSVNAQIEFLLRRALIDAGRLARPSATGVAAPDERSATVLADGFEPPTG